MKGYYIYQHKGANFLYLGPVSARDWKSALKKFKERNPSKVKGKMIKAISSSQMSRMMKQGGMSTRF